MSGRVLRLVGLLLLSGGLGGLAHQAQVRADDLRRSAIAVSQSRVMPDPGTIRAASMGQQTFLADLLWVRVALSFADLVLKPDGDGPKWLVQVMRSVITLDPGWRTPYFYGGSMMRVLDNIDGSDEIFTAAMEAFPEDPYFPFSVGMNAYLYRKDPERAADLLSRAATLPGAPRWYGAAAAGFLDEHGQRKAALAYLQEQLEVEEEPGVREALERKYRDVLHDELASLLDERRRLVEAQQGRSITDLSLLGVLPDEPLGGAWIIAPDGAVRSSVAEERLARTLRDRERGMLIHGR